MLTLSIRQPWAWCVVAGHKRVENRSWPTRHRGWLLIHAAAAAAPRVRLPGGLRPPPGLARGAILGAVRLVDVVEYGADFAADPWAGGAAWCWRLGDARAFPEPVPCKGALGLWAPPASAALRRQLRAVGLGPH
jgi:hypothetical protein